MDDALRDLLSGKHSVDEDAAGQELVEFIQRWQPKLLPGALSGILTAATVSLVIRESMMQRDTFIESCEAVWDMASLLTEKTDFKG